ncbi:NAD(P)-binding protein [Mollisia scopiformis]|uniref:NAD(P)-binding protein n=1 Tax=Mollisia scopiformis TaxID=149040 RepID=A0A132B9S3_MOLSC|nr:NAD(P)-binding protein [Mollisia scopiformis]KUJ08749.1 NAD(P)-binding protein [Mollisia scopiformis]
MAARKVLIVGASGGVGGALLKQLLSTSNPPSIRVSTRSLGKATFPSTVEVVQGDLEDPSSYPRLLKGIDRVFMYANSQAPLQQLLSAAKDGGVQYIVLLSSMTVEFAPESSIGKKHLTIEDAVKESGIAYTFLRPRNSASNSRLFWAPIVEKTAKLWITFPNSHTAPVSEHDIVSETVVFISIQFPSRETASSRSNRYLQLYL